MIMFWHRRKLLEIEEQLKGISIQLNETISSVLEGIGKEHGSLQHSLGRIEDGMVKLEQGQGKIIDLLTALTGEHHAGQEKISSIVDAQRTPMMKLLDLMGTQGDSMKALSEAVAEIKVSLGHNQQECAAHNEKVLSALHGTENTISEKMAVQYASVIESQDTSTKSLFDDISATISKVQTSFNQGQQDSAQRGDRLMKALQEAEHTLTDKLTEKANSIKSDVDNIKSELSEQGGTIHAIDTVTQRVGADMGTLDEAMRLLLVNTLLNNLHEK